MKLGWLLHWISLMVKKNNKKILKKFLGCRDPRWKHEYLDSGQIWITTGEEEEELDESDKHI